MNWLKLAPWIAAAAIGVFAGIERIQISNRDVTIAEKNTALAEMREQQAENIATAVKAVAANKDADAAKTTVLVAALTKDKQALEERVNAAETALAAVPETVTPTGCPVPLDSPVLQSFIAGLPRP